MRVIDTVRRDGNKQGPGDIPLGKVITLYVSLTENIPEDQSRERDVVTTSLALRMSTGVDETVSITKSTCCVLMKSIHKLIYQHD